MESMTIYEVPGLKASYKMRKAIEKLERKHGSLNKRFLSSVTSVYVLAVAFMTDAKLRALLFRV